MATLDGGSITLADWSKRQDPGNKHAVIVEILNQSNEILDDMTFLEGNLPTGHRSTIRTQLPTAYWRAVNQGVPTSKSVTAQVDEPVGLLESFSQVDKEIAMLNGDIGTFRIMEAKAFIEAMGQEMASTFFYGNHATNSEEFNGLTLRYSSLTGGGSAQNVLSAGGTAANKQSSIWLICWGHDRVTGIYPKGSMAGLEHEDIGLETIQETESASGTEVINKLFRGYRDRFTWKCGLSVRDWRYAVRIANVDATVASPAAIIPKIIEATNLVPNGALAGKCGLYMNRTVKSVIEVESYNNVKGGGMTYQDVGGRKVAMVMGIPIRTSDALLNNEAVLT